MPRAPRISPGGLVYHVLNRANGRLRLFKKEEDFLAFERVLLQTQQRHPLRILGWCLMGNHWHFVVWPRKDGELSRFFGYLSLTHAARWQASHNAIGMGHVYQSRFKSFMIQQDEHLAWVLRYVERNPLRAKLVTRAQAWRHSSLHVRLHGPAELRDLLSAPPIELPRDWVGEVNRPQTDAEQAAIIECMKRGRPLGQDRWVRTMAARYNLDSTLRPRGRQKGWRRQKGQPEKKEE
jgi:putative transposase